MLSEENEIAILELQQLVEKSRDLREEDFYTIFTIHEVQNIATVLNLITKLQKGEEQSNKCIHELDEEITNKNNKIFDLEVKNEKLQKENEEKDNQIDLMAEYIDENDTSLANYLYRKNGKCNKEMIKQYFKRKATNDG